LIVGGNTVGIVQFVFDSTRDYGILKQNKMDMFRAEQYIKEALPVIETKLLMNTLRESALRDQMTGLHNRRYLQEYTEPLVAGAVRRGKNIGLIMCDLDYFKQVNDTYGHNVGDTVLKETALL
jgi:two-component system cell cycle response regulator